MLALVTEREDSSEKYGEEEAITKDSNWPCENFSSSTKNGAG
jgi:hypothetical protein